ncbi:MAG: tetratricopeptide repeat protein [Planctomycetota bacterium]|jgi:tetratricopeptide (TPR) repeat protein
MKPASVLCSMTLGSLTLGALPLAALTFSATPAFAATEDDVQEDIAFARGLARDWQFVDLAQRVLDDVSGRDLGGDERRELDLVRCEVVAEAARYEPDPARREGLYTEALDAYENFLSSNPDATGAASDYISLGRSYAFVQGLSLENAAGAERERITEALASRLESIQERAGDLALELDSRRSELSVSELGQLWNVQLARCEMLVSLAETTGERGWLSTAEPILEELPYETGLDSRPGLQAFTLLGDIYALRGDHSDAGDLFDYVIDTTIPVDREMWEDKKQDLPQANQLACWYFVQLVTPRLLNARSNAGQQQAVANAALHLINTLNNEGYSPSSQGYLAMIESARALLSLGGYVGGSLAAGELSWYPTLEELQDAGVRKNQQRSVVDLALSLGNRVNRENQGNSLQVRAQELMAEVIDTPGVEVSSEMLFEAAQGAYNGRKFEEAITGLRRTIAALSDDAERQLMMPKLLYHLGRSMSYLGRDTEAAMAFAEATSVWAGDEEYDSLNAQAYLSVAQRLQRANKDDAQYEVLLSEAEAMYGALSEDGDTGSIAYRQAMKLMERGQFAEARAKFKEVGTDAPKYERAVVKAAVCSKELGNTDVAKRELTDYTEKFVTRPENQLGSRDGARKSVRQSAQAEAYFTLGDIEREAGEWSTAIAIYRTLPDDFPTQKSLATVSLYHCVNGSAEIGRLDDADSFLERMIEQYPQDKYTGQAAGQLYNAYAGRFSSAVEGSAERLDYGRRAANALSLSNRLADDPSFPRLRDEAKLWLDAEQWETAEGILVELIAKYENDKDRARNIEKQVKPWLGEALMGQRRMEEAYLVLDPLVPLFDDKETDLKPAQETVVLFCKSVAGWVEGDPANPTVVPGRGGDDAFEKAGPWWRKLSGTEDNYSCPWYEFEFQRAFTYWQWSKVNTSKSDYAQSLVRTMRTDTEGFALIEETCGEDRLRRLYQWLAGQQR